MDIFTFVATLLIAFIGIFLGGVLSYWSRDEIHKYKHTIPYVQMVLFVLLFVSIFTYFPFPIALILLVLSFAFIYFFWHKMHLNVLDYIVLGLLFVITSLTAEAHFYATTIITLFGISSGALFYVLHTKPSGLMKNKKTLHIWHHKHSNKHLHIDDILTALFYKYYFFPIIAICSYIIAEIMAVLL